MDPSSPSRKTPIERPKHQEQSPSTRISITTSPAKIVAFVPSPPSPTKSVAGAIVDVPSYDVYRPSPQERALVDDMNQPWHQTDFQNIHPQASGASLDPSLSRNFFDQDSSEDETTSRPREAMRTARRRTQGTVDCGGLINSEPSPFPADSLDIPYMEELGDELGRYVQTRHTGWAPADHTGFGSEQAKAKSPESLVTHRSGENGRQREHHHAPFLDDSRTPFQSSESETVDNLTATSIPIEEKHNMMQTTIEDLILLYTDQQAVDAAATDPAIAEKLARHASSPPRLHAMLPAEEGTNQLEDSNSPYVPGATQTISTLGASQVAASHNAAPSSSAGADHFGLLEGKYRGERKRSVVSRQPSHTWGNPEDLWANVTFAPSNLPHMIDAFDGSQQSPPAPTSKTNDRILKAWKITLEAILREETQVALQNNSSTSGMDSHFENVHQCSPTRPERPYSQAANFMLDRQVDQATEQSSAPIALPKTSTVPPPVDVHSIEGLNMNAGRPQSSSPSTNTVKNVQLAPPPMRLENSHYRPPEVYTPFPFSRLGLSNAPISPCSPILSSPTLPEWHENLVSSTTPPNATGEKAPIRTRSRLRKTRWRRPKAPPLHPTTIPPESAGDKMAPTLMVFVHRRQAPNARRAAHINLPHETCKKLPVQYRANNIGRSVEKECSSSTMERFQNEKHFARLDFDDSAFFTQLRESYYRVLLGDYSPSRFWRRWCSARTLKRIAAVPVSTTATVTPEHVIEREDNSPEKELMDLFRHPTLGSGRYTWVRWAQSISRLQDCVPSPQPHCAAQDSAIDEREQTTDRVPDAATAGHSVLPSTGFSTEIVPERPRKVSGSSLAGDSHPAVPVTSGPLGLEFIEGWSVSRIALAFALVLLATSAVCVLWIVLGPDTLGPADAGATRASAAVDGRVHTYGNASSPGAPQGVKHPEMRAAAADARSARVVSGIVMSVVVLLAGWTATAVWIGVSWLVM